MNLTCKELEIASLFIDSATPGVLSCSPYCEGTDLRIQDMNDQRLYGDFRYADLSRPPFQEALSTIMSRSSCLPQICRTRIWLTRWWGTCTWITRTCFARYWMPRTWLTRFCITWTWLVRHTIQRRLVQLLQVLKIQPARMQVTVTAIHPVDSKSSIWLPLSPIPKLGFYWRSCALSLRHWPWPYLSSITTLPCSNHRPGLS